MNGKTQYARVERMDVMCEGDESIVRPVPKEAVEKLLADPLFMYVTARLL